jgi:tripartite-type tricarboxylate transporter receptor subunit TctC
MTTLRKSVLGMVFGLLVATIGTQVHAQTQQYPNRPVTLIVPFTAGGVTDTIARLVGKKLSERLGQAVIVENKPGVGGSLATEYVARAVPDGYTIGVGTRGTHATNLAIYKNVKYDPIKDFIAINTIGDAATILVANPSRPYKSVKELIAYAKANPGQVNFATAGNGTAAHLTGELFMSLASIKMTHVPYKGSAPAVQDVIAGNVDIAFDYPSSTLGQINVGMLRPLAVVSDARLSPLPNVPTIAEAGLPGAESQSWLGLFVPAKTPQPIVNKLISEVEKIMAEPEIGQRLVDLGCVPFSVGGAKFEALVASEIVKWGNVVKQANIKPN